VISTGESACEVAFDFTIGPRQFHAVRRTPNTTQSGLSEREGDEWIQDVSGSDRLTRRIEELLGLDFDSFTKTVILPQGRYAEFLSSEPSKRRDLLEKILELGVYKRVVDRAKELETTWDKSGLLATTTFAPGTSAGDRSRAHLKKKSSRAFRSVAVKTVNLGSGERLLPSNDGGIRQIPPFPFRSFSCCSEEYSTNPYGGSVTTA
jgi:hypothetical protein